MYKYVIIDDELLTRKGTIEKLAPVANILQCTGEAEDGEQGLQLIEAVHPDCNNRYEDAGYGRNCSASCSG